MTAQPTFRDHIAAPHPTDFYIVHKLFTFHRQRQTVTQWGSLTDGPADKTDVLEAMRDLKEAPTLATLRVFHFCDGAPARDVTDDMIGAAADYMADLHRGAA